ncbi:hypothetical protein JZU46_06080 [bacterium]|jgi:hypothetical protein|nr:hypothetical protein [bacterium]
MNYVQSVIAIASSLVVLLVAGFLNISAKRRDIIIKHMFAVEYAEKFSDFAMQALKQEQLSDKLYVWLTKNVDKMQESLGVIGIVQYKPPFSQYAVKNYQMLINTLHQISNRTAHNDDINLCYHLLVRYVGVLEEAEKSTKKQLRNPFIWFSEGVRLAVTSPLYLLNWFGLLGSSTAERLSESLLARLISGIFALVGFLASIVQILQGWDDVVNFLRAV